MTPQSSGFRDAIRHRTRASPFTVQTRPGCGRQRPIRHRHHRKRRASTTPSSLSSGWLNRTNARQLARQRRWLDERVSFPRSSRLAFRVSSVVPLPEPHSVGRVQTWYPRTRASDLGMNRPRHHHLQRGLLRVLVSGLGHDCRCRVRTARRDQIRTAVALLRSVR